MVALHVFAIDQVGNVEDHLAGLSEAATDFLVQRCKKAMHLEADGACTGLSLALAGCRFTKISKVSAAYFIRRKLCKLSRAGAVIYQDLEVHLGLATQFVDVAEELALVGPDGFAETFVVIEDGTEAERKYGRVFEAISDNASMIHT